MKSKGFITANFGKWHINKDPLYHGFDFNVGGSNKGNPGKNGYFSPFKIDFIENKQLENMDGADYNRYTYLKELSKIKRES